MGSHAALIAKLEQAQEGSPALDVEVCAAVHRDLFVPIPRYTTSLDDAVDLVPEGWLVECLKQDTNERWHCFLIDRADDEDEDDESVGALNSSTPALALCIAILRAVEAEGENHE